MPATLRAAPGTLVARLALPGDDAYLGLFLPPWHSETYVAFLERPDTTRPFSPNVVDVAGALVVRRSRVAALLRPLVESGTVALRPVAIAAHRAVTHPRFEKAPLDPDFCLIDPLRHVAADRRQLDVDSFDWGRREAPGSTSSERALLTSVHERPFGEGRMPTQPLFRLHDLPLDVWVEPALVAALRKALGDELGVGRMQPSPSFTISHTDFELLPGSAAEADAAAAAYFAALGSTPSAAQREAILRNARYAYLLARDEGPAADTRAAAIAHPAYAVVYARDVDRGARDDTRAAAAALVNTAMAYAVHVDEGEHEVTRARLRGSYKLAEYEREVAVAAARKLRALPAPPPKPKPAPVATTSLGWSAMLLAGASSLALRVGVPWSTSESVAWSLRLRDGDVLISTIDGPRGAKLAQRLPELRVLSDANNGPWIFPRAIAERMFAGVANVKLWTVRFEHRGELVATDLVHAQIIEDRPLDRRASKASYADKQRPWSSLLRTLVEGQPLARAGDEITVVRVAEYPSLILASAPLVARWRADKAPVQAIAQSHAHLVGPPRFASSDDCPPFPELDDDAAVAALRAVYGGELGKRGEAIAHPLFAYAIARWIDGAPRDDTRAAALAHPHAAALYARFVDDAPRDDTRAAASRSGPSAAFYAEHVDLALHPTLRPLWTKRGVRDEDLAKYEAKLARVREHASPRG